MSPPLAPSRAMGPHAPHRLLPLLLSLSPVAATGRGCPAKPPATALLSPRRGGQVEALPLPGVVLLGRLWFDTTEQLLQRCDLSAASLSLSCRGSSAGWSLVWGPWPQMGSSGPGSSVAWLPYGRGDDLAGSLDDGIVASLSHQGGQSFTGPSRPGQA
jgi:hypothetical protein